MGGRKDRYSPHLGSPRFERSPPLSSNWRNKVIRLAAKSKAANPSCVWTPGPLADLLYSEWDNLSAGQKASWEDCPHYPQCPAKARFILRNLDEFNISYWVFKEWPRIGGDDVGTTLSQSAVGGVGKIFVGHSYTTERDGWIWTFSRHLDSLPAPTVEDIAIAGLYDGSLSYVVTDEPVNPGYWHTRIIGNTHEGVIWGDMFNFATVT